MSSFLTESTQISNEKLKLQEDNKKNSDNNITSNKQEETKIYLIKGSFIVTYALLLTTGLITFIEAIRTQNPLIRHILNLETCISLVASFFYSIFISQLDKFEKEYKPIDWYAIAKTRYIDWAITTPFMLLVLVLVLANESKIVVRLTTVTSIIIFNYLMLYIGYLGEIKVLDRFTAFVGGFIPFFALFYLLYTLEVENSL